MKKFPWIAVVIFSVVLLLVILAGVALLGVWGYGSYGRIGPGMMGPGMMGGWGYGPLGWFGMMFMWLIPVSLIVLVALGVVWLVRAVDNSGVPPSPARACPNCGRTAQVDWRTCPYCGQVLP